jgi:YVTN family beta-propeller protein
MKPIYRFIFGLTIVLSGCEKQPDNPLPDKPVVTKNGGIYILNEGNYQSGNATIDYYDFNSQKLSTNAFEAKNNRSLGDVLQSMLIVNDKGYLVVNNSQKIEVIDRKDFSSLATITGFKSPRNIVLTYNDKAFVSEYYSGGIKEVDLNNHTITNIIPLGGNIDGMVLYNNKLFATNALANFIYVIDIISKTVTDSIKVGYGSNSMQLDANNKLWVLCAGSSNPDFILGGLVCVNPDNHAIEKTFPLTQQTEHGPIKLLINDKKNTLYWINQHVYRHQISDSVVAKLPFINAIKSNFWALGYDSLNQEIYVGDAVDFVQKSSINRYSNSGQLLGSFKTGIITGGFYFHYQK